MARTRFASPLIGALALLVAAPAAEAGFREREVREAATAGGFGVIAGRLADASRPTVVIDRRRRPVPRRLGTSRLGGPPDLPAGTPWPQCGGRPQTFLGQFRLRDLPRAARPLRRHGGRLLFFTEVEFEDPSDTTYGLWGGRCTTVVHAKPGTRLERRARPALTLKVRNAAVRFKARPDVPDASWDHGNLAPPMLDVRVGDDRQLPFLELRLDLRGTKPHRLLGYIDSPNGEGGRCWDRTRRRSGAWWHLFTMGPDLRFEVADAGQLQVAIAPADLRRGSFDRVCGIFDSA